MLFDLFRAKIQFLIRQYRHPYRGIQYMYNRFFYPNLFFYHILYSSSAYSPCSAVRQSNFRPLCILKFSGHFLGNMLFSSSAYSPCSAVRQSNFPPLRVLKFSGHFLGNMLFLVILTSPCSGRKKYQHRHQFQAAGQHVEHQDQF